MTEEQKASCAAAIASLVRRMINDDETDLDQVSGGVLYNPYEDEFEYDPQAKYRDPWKITDADGLFGYLDGGGDASIKWAIRSPEEVGAGFVDCYAYDITEHIEEIREEFKD